MKTIAIVAGGDSSEFEVSIKSANEVAEYSLQDIWLYYYDKGNQLVLGGFQGKVP